MLSQEVVTLIQLNLCVELAVMYQEHRCVLSMEQISQNTSAATVVQLQYSFVLEQHISATHVMMISKESQTFHEMNCQHVQQVNYNCRAIKQRSPFLNLMMHILPKVNLIHPPVTNSTPFPNTLRVIIYFHKTIAHIQIQNYINTCF